ncbi:hypothetical protein [Kocuria flava]|nr:hypothetical protein [Kocuria flava]
MTPLPHRLLTLQDLDDLGPVVGSLRRAVREGVLVRVVPGV